MSRPSFRPRPLDIHKKLPIVKSIKELEDDEAPTTATSTRNAYLLRLTAEVNNEVQPVSTKRCSQEIPTPQYNVVETYERDYIQSFAQPSSYLRGRGARAELGEFVEYDLDNEDEDWLQELNNERKLLAPEKLELILFKLELLDHKVREKAGIVATVLGSPVPVLLQFDAAVEALQSLSIRYGVIQSVYTYWKSKREQWQKPILRLLQPPPPVNDTNPYNVFRPREKVHRLHTRRMQRRENNVQSFEKLRQVRRNMGHAKMVLEALIKREEKKREIMENEVNLQRLQIKHRHEAQLLEDGLASLGFPMGSFRFGSSEDDLMDSDDVANGRRFKAAAAFQNQRSTNSRRIIIPTGRMKRDLKQRQLSNGWNQKDDHQENILLFAKPLDPERLSAAGIAPPPNPPPADGSSEPPFCFRGRVGRGGRIIFDRWNPLLRAPIGSESSSYSPQNTRRPLPNG